MKGDKAKGIIHVDSDTSLSGVPAEAWEFKLGNLCALDRVLDQHKEHKPKDPVIAASFTISRLATFKDSVIELIGRVTRVSMETVRITEEMRAASR